MIKWSNTLYLFTIEEYEQLPDGIILECIDGSFKKKGEDNINLDTRFGVIAYGIRNPFEHELKELFFCFMLTQ